MNRNPNENNYTGRTNKQRVDQIRNRKILTLCASLIVCLFLVGTVIYQAFTQQNDNSIGQTISMSADRQTSETGQQSNGNQGFVFNTENTQETQRPTKTPIQAPTKAPTAVPTQAPTQTPTARPINSVSIRNSRDGYSLASEVGGIEIIDYGASSILADQYGVYTIENCFDGNLNTTWAEGETGDGIGSNITGVWEVESGSWQMTGVAIWAGYHKSSDVFYKNNRPRRITLDVYSGGEFDSFDINLNDSESGQYILFNYPLPIDDDAQIWITINSVYSGSKYTDTCISDIDLLVQRR